MNKDGKTYLDISCETYRVNQAKRQLEVWAFYHSYGDETLCYAAFNLDDADKGLYGNVIGNSDCFDQPIGWKTSNVHRGPSGTAALAPRLNELVQFLDGNARFLDNGLIRTTLDRSNPRVAFSGNRCDGWSFEDEVKGCFSRLKALWEAGTAPSVLSTGNDQNLSRFRCQRFTWGNARFFVPSEGASEVECQALLPGAPLDENSFLDASSLSGMGIRHVGVFYFPDYRIGMPIDGNLPLSTVITKQLQFIPEFWKDMFEADPDSLYSGGVDFGNNFFPEFISNVPTP